MDTTLERSSSTKESHEPATVHAHFRLAESTVADLDEIAAWLARQGFRRGRRGPTAVSRADALRHAVQAFTRRIQLG